jgi:hypothetical protein
MTKNGSHGSLVAEASLLASVLLATAALVMFGGLFFNYEGLGDAPTHVWIIFTSTAGTAGVALLVAVFSRRLLPSASNTRRRDRKVFMSTIGIPYVSYVLALLIATPAARWGVGGANLNLCFQGAAPLVGAILIALVIETTPRADAEPIWRLRRAAGLAFILSGSVLAVVGLIPGQGTSTPASSSLSPQAWSRRLP